MKRTLLLLTLAIGLLCGTAAESFAQNLPSPTVRSIPNGSLVTYDNLVWTLPTEFILVQYGPADDGSYVMYFENAGEDYVYLSVELLEDDWATLSRDDRWEELYFLLEDYADMVDEGEDPVVWGDGYSRTDDVLQAAGYYYYYPAQDENSKDDYMYIEYIAAGKYGIAAKAAAWDTKTRETMVRIIHSIKVN